MAREKPGITCQMAKSSFPTTVPPNGPYYHYIVTHRKYLVRLMAQECSSLVDDQIDLILIEEVKKELDLSDVKNRVASTHLDGQRRGKPSHSTFLEWTKGCADVLEQFERVGPLVRFFKPL